MKCFVITLARGRMLAWNVKPVPPEGLDKGWRPYVWTTDVGMAEKFGSEQAAATFARKTMRHDDWSVREITTTGAVA